MKRIWRMAGVGLLMVTVGAQAVAEERDNGPRGDGGGQHERGPEGGRPGGNEQPRPQSNPPRPENNQPRPQNQHFDRGGQNSGGQWQGHPQGNEQGRPQPQPQPSNNLPIQSRPDTVRQTQPPQRGYYQDVPRRNDNNQHWNGYIGVPSSDNHWQGRPSGRANGWGPGPQYRPGHVIDRFADRDYRVPYRGMDYFYSGGYWYRPLGPRYVVVEPPRGIRVSYLPDYAEQVLIGGSVLFLAAGSYYAYEESSREYVVVEPPVGTLQPQQQPQVASNGYDVEAYPANGQSAEQVNQDGYECYQYAVQQSGFDPRTATYQPDPSVVQTYRQAQGNCLSSRGYQVQ